MDVSKYEASLDAFCSALNDDQSALLYLACGPGNVPKHILEKHPRFELSGLDLSEEMVKLARIYNPSAKFEVYDFRKILALDHVYDGILCAFLLPYLSKDEALQLIADAALKLNDNGVFYLSTMKDDYSKSSYQKGSSGDELFMHFHESSYLIEALEENKLALFYDEKVLSKNEDGSITTDLILIAKKA